MPRATPGDGSFIRVDPMSDPRWADLVRQAHDSLVFHHPLWLELVRSQARCRVGAWAVVGRDGQLTAGLPFALVRSRLAGTRLVALPYSTRCPVLQMPGHPVDPAGFADAVRTFGAERQLAVELRDGFAAAHGAPVTRTFVGHRLSLDGGMTAVTQRFSRGQRSNIAKARREGVEVVRRTDTDALQRFYRLHLATRRRLGLPTPPQGFILRFARLFDAGLGFVMLARHHDQDAAAAVFLTTGGTLFYEAGASDPRLLGARPNNLLFREAIGWACDTGHHTVDFGRTDADNAGLLQFKESWGAPPAPLLYCRYGDAPDAAGGARPALGASAGARRALGAVISHAPPAFGSLVGTAYYRHFG